MHASLSKRLKEGGFLLLLAIGVYFLMALFSYSPDDPSYLFESAKRHADNAGGLAGDPGARDPAADDQYVKCSAVELGDVCFA